MTIRELHEKIQAEIDLRLEITSEPLVSLQDKIRQVRARRELNEFLEAKRIIEELDPTCIQ